MHIYTLVHAHTHMYTYRYIDTFIFIHIHTYIHTHMSGIKKRVQYKNTYTMTFNGNNRYLYWIILANNNAEKNQFTAINNSLEDAVCIYF